MTDANGYEIINTENTDGSGRFNHYNNHWKFYPKDYITFPNAEYVHPINQLTVELLFDQIYQDQNVRLLVIFGSSVDMRCSFGSDVDLYMETLDKSIYPKVSTLYARNGCDMILNITDWDTGIGKSIARDGIILFDRRCENE